MSKVKFLYNNHVKNCDAFYYSEQRALYVLAGYTKGENHFLSFSELNRNLEKDYNSKINFRQLNYFLKKHFIVNEQGYKLTDSEKNALFYTEKFKLDFDNALKKDEEEIISELLDDYQRYDFNIYENLKNLYTLKAKAGATTKDQVLANYFSTLSLEHELTLKIDQYFSESEKNNLHFPIEDFITESTALKLCSLLNIQSLSDLNRLSPKAIFSLFSWDLESIYSHLTILSTDYSIIEDIDKIFSSLKPKEYLILSKRYAFEGEKETLESIGSALNLTRERCRQIELKATNKVLSLSEEVNKKFLFVFSKIKEKDYISTDQLLVLLENKIRVRELMFILEYSDNNLKCNSKYHVIYDSRKITMAEIISDFVQTHGKYLTVEESKSFNLLESAILENDYRIKQEKIYLKNGVLETTIYLDLIVELFPSGYRISESNDDYQKLKTEFFKRYKISSFPEAHAIAALLERANFIQRDKGTYICKNYAIELPEELIAEIIDFLYQQKQTTFYLTIYEQFKSKLNALGVDNYFYLKGLLDPWLPNDFKSKRNYIRFENDKKSSTEEIVNFCKKFPNTFQEEDVLNAFKGVKQYTIYNVLYCQEKEGLIRLSGKKFIYLDKLNLTQSTTSELRKMIEEAFKDLESDCLSSRALYDRLTSSYPALLAELKEIDSHFALFSLIKVLFDDYTYSRPLISKSPVDLNTTTIIYSYAKSLDIFDYNTIKTYISKMHLKSLYSYANFIDDLKDDFVQIDKSTLIKKEKFQLDREKLSKIKSLITTNLENGELDTRVFSKYQLFPNIGHIWCKYLLAGIVRSYLESDFTIINTESQYDSTDYIIKMK